MEMTLQQFWDELNRHDWYHEMSDDERVNRIGAANWTRLKKIAEGKPEYKRMMAEFVSHYYSGPPWPTAKTPKPRRPE